jgi:capsular exopolysaccharide synthesis family protein
MARLLAKSSSPPALDGTRAGSSLNVSSAPSLDTHLRDYLRVLVKRRWTAVTGLVLALGFAASHAYTATPIYEATVQILIEHENTSEFSLQDSTAQDRQTTDYYNTQYTVLQSRSLMRRTIESLRAWSHPELSGGASVNPGGILDGPMRSASMLMARLRRRPGSAPEGAAPAAGPQGSSPASQSEAATTEKETPAEASVIDAMVSRVTIAPVKNSRLVDVKVKAVDPKFAADAANAVARSYIDQNLEARMNSSKETTEWLTQQLTEQRRRIEESEAALQNYRERRDSVSLSDRQNIVVQRLSDLNAMVTRAKGDRLQRETVYKQVVAFQENGGSLDSLPTILSDSFLRERRAELSALQKEREQLSEQLGENHPTMVKLRASIANAESELQAELANRVQAIRNDFESAQALEADLNVALEAQKDEALSLNRMEIDYGVLEREVMANREIFDSLLARTREKGIAGELKASDVRVIDAAEVPRGPVWPNRRLMLMYGLFFGCFLGVGLAFFFEYLDDRIKTPDEIKSYLGLPVMGMVPLTRRRSTPPLISGDVPPIFAEAFRGVRTRVIFSSERQIRSLVVTSTAPGEGKTCVSSNLAVGLAMTGQRVVLLDVDMRRPRVHEVFGLQKEPGLSELLAGRARTQEAMHRIPHSGLWVLPSGALVENPTELLSSPRFTAFLEGLTDTFQWVIIDSPPVAAVTDASVVANQASAVLFVVGSELTARSAAMNAIEQLDAANATFIGAVLNRVKLRRNAYYYSAYYKPGYEHYQTSGSQRA